MRRRGRRERGVTLVEAAIVTPLFFLLLIGIIEGGLLMRSNLTIGAVTSDAGRAATTYGSDSDADFQILQQVRSAAGSVGVDKVQRVVIFRASGPTASVPSSCRTTSSTTLACNSYSASQVAGATETQFGGTSGRIDSSWPPSTRKTALTGPLGPPDYIGIYVELRHDAVSGAFGGSRTITRTTVMRLEPQSLDG